MVSFPFVRDQKNNTHKENYNKKKQQQQHQHTVNH